MKKIILILLLILSGTCTFSQKIDNYITKKETSPTEILRNIDKLRDLILEEEIKFNHLLFDKLIEEYEVRRSHIPFFDFADQYKYHNKHLKKLYDEFDKARSEMNAYKEDDKEKTYEIIKSYNNKRDTYCIAKIKHHVALCKKANQYINLEIDQSTERRLHNDPEVKLQKNRISLLKRMISIKEERYLQFL